MVQKRGTRAETRGGKRGSIPTMRGNGLVSHRFGAPGPKTTHRPWNCQRTVPHRQNGTAGHTQALSFQTDSRKSRRVGHISTTCFQELGGFLQACLRLNHTNKHSSHQLRRRIVGSHGNKWPPEPGSNLSSCDNSPQFTALVSRPIRGGPLLPGATW